MKRFSFLVASFLGILTYVILSLVGGKDGLWSETQLNEQKQILSMHTAEIQKINDELSLECIALQKDKDVIASYAKRLGYVGENEKLVKITGLQAAPVTLYNPGTVLKRQPVFYISEWVCKACALVVFFLAFMIFLLWDVSHGMENPDTVKVEVVKGIPIYDLPQV
ncbi:MAG: septum formation initiator family protein [Treponema sp.]|nr:septum formation initiator family protein [Treponema sp.]